MDTAMGYDLRDPSKAHHPLVAGRVSLTAAHNVIHWGLCALSVLAVLISTKLSPNPLYAVICIFLWFVFGYAYNSGLSKESPLGFMSISVCYAMMAAWGWLLSHPELTPLGWIYVAYAFMTILWQISYEGHLKELEAGERSNILVLLGARVEGGRFRGGWAGWLGGLLKVVHLGVGFLLLLMVFDFGRLAWFIVTCGASLYLTYEMVRDRPWVRDRELMRMSLQEIAVIYLPVPLLLDPVTSALLMLAGVVYFFGVNRAIWGKPHPAV